MGDQWRWSLGRSRPPSDHTPSSPHPPQAPPPPLSQHKLNSQGLKKPLPLPQSHTPSHEPRPTGLRPHPLPQQLRALPSPPSTQGPPIHRPRPHRGKKPHPPWQRRGGGSWGHGRSSPSPWGALAPPTGTRHLGYQRCLGVGLSQATPPLPAGGGGRVMLNPGLGGVQVNLMTQFWGHLGGFQDSWERGSRVNLGAVLAENRTNLIPIFGGARDTPPPF